uniref:COesterase domain-containing protein n=1 Tax=Gongylonema pulchrum TaxID=637853 RepID=A0A183DAQ5_9BILA
LLNVDVTRLEGTMTVNIPPPPSDRLWYAFRTPPKLSIRSVPQVGDRSVDMSTVSSWIENKLRLLLEKNLVCPNMDDLIVPVMSGNELLKSGYNQ